MQLKFTTPCQSCPKSATCGLIDCSTTIKNIWCDDFKTGLKPIQNNSKVRPAIDPYLVRQMPMSSLN